MPDLDALLNPNTIAIIGASPDEAKLRGMLPAVMLSHPYPGKIFPVSRSHEEVMGLKAYSSIAEVPEPVDLAILAIPSQFVADELVRCGDAGVKAALIVTSGFAEEAGESGRAVQQKLAEIAGAYDMAVLGPNSEGLANTALSIAATFSPAMMAPSKPMLPPWHAEGRVAVVAQSGAVGFSFFDVGREKELPFRYVVTTGNEACLEIFDLVDFMLDEGKTDVFLLFLEDVKSPQKFKAVAEKALRMGKPLIAAKLGRSQAAVRATASHTGAMAGSYETYTAMFSHYGITIGDSAEQMVDIANTFLSNLDRLPSGRRIGISTGSGGAGAWMADACAGLGLDVPELDADARTEIDAYLPTYGTSQNPVDGTAQAIREIGYAELARLVSSADNVDGIVMVASTRKKNGFERERDNFFKLGQSLEKPIACWSYTLPHETSVELFAEAGLPLHTNMLNCARSMAALVEYQTKRDGFLDGAKATPEPHANRAKAQALLDQSGTVLCEYEARAVLALYGIGVASGGLAKSAGEAVKLGVEARGPVALKIQSSDIPHKSDAGGVALGLEGMDAVREGYERIIETVAASHPGAELKGVLVEPMAPSGVEVILGINRDPTFGPMLLAGLAEFMWRYGRIRRSHPFPYLNSRPTPCLARSKVRAYLTG